MSRKRKSRTLRLPRRAKPKAAKPDTERVPPGSRLPVFPAAIRPTRREFLVGAGSLLLGASGCGGEESGGESPEGRLIRHEYGEARVPENPEKIMVLDPALLDITLALGVVPAGASPIFPSEDAPGPFPPYLDDVESLASFGPDLIVGSVFISTRAYTGNYPRSSRPSPSPHTATRCGKKRLSRSSAKSTAFPRLRKKLSEITGRGSRASVRNSGTPEKSWFPS